MTEPAQSAREEEPAAAAALVILPFRTTQQAEQFAALVMAQFGAEGFQVPFVTTGTAYDYRNEETGEIGQVFELFPDARWEAFIKEGNEAHHVLQRITQEGTDASTG